MLILKSFMWVLFFFFIQVADASTEEKIYINVNESLLVSLPSRWEEYFGTHYTNIRKGNYVWSKTVREYDGPHVRLPDLYDVSGYKEYPEELLKNFRNWRRHSAQGFDKNAIELKKHGLTAIYGCCSTMSNGILDVEQTEALLYSVYFLHPELVKNVFFQWGNEINGKHLGQPYEGIEKKFKFTKWSGFNRKEDQVAYIENFLLPAVSVVQKVSMDVFNDSSKIKIMSPSFSNIYNPKFRKWMYGILDSPISEHWSLLRANSVWEVIDILTVHYPFSALFGGDVMQEIWDRYGKTGKIDGLWITEEGGKHFKGSIDIIDRAINYIEWVAKNGLTSDQTRLLWWGLGRNTTLGGDAKEVLDQMGDWMMGRELYLRNFPQSSWDIHMIIAKKADVSIRNVIVARNIGSGKYLVVLEGVNIQQDVKMKKYCKDEKSSLLQLKPIDNNKVKVSMVVQKEDTCTVMFLWD